MNIKLIYLTFVDCTCKFENDKQSFLSETMNKLSLIKSIKPTAHEEHKQSFPSENYNRTFHNKSIKNLTHMKSINNLPQ